MTDQPEPKPRPEATHKTPGSGGNPAGPQGPPPESGSSEAPDRDTPAWEGPEPDEAIGLVDPRHEIPNPPGL